MTKTDNPQSDRPEVLDRRKLLTAAAAITAASTPSQAAPERSSPAQTQRRQVAPCDMPCAKREEGLCEPVAAGAGDIEARSFEWPAVLFSWTQRRSLEGDLA